MSIKKSLKNEQKSIDKVRLSYYNVCITNKKGDETVRKYDKHKKSDKNKQNNIDKLVLITTIINLLVAVVNMMTVIIDKLY